MYVAGLVIPVPEEKRDAYRRWAEHSAATLKEYGCVEVVEAWEDNVPDGTYTDFRRAVAAKEGERIVFAWQVWPDKATKDAARVAGLLSNRVDFINYVPVSDIARLKRERGIAVFQGESIYTFILYPDMRETLKACEGLANEGFAPMVYCVDDPIAVPVDLDLEPDVGRAHPFGPGRDPEPDGRAGVEAARGNGARGPDEREVGDGPCAPLGVRPRALGVELERRDGRDGVDGRERTGLQAAPRERDREAAALRGRADRPQWARRRGGPPEA